VYILYRFTFDFDLAIASQVMLKLFGNKHIADWLLQAALWFTLPVSVLLVLFGSTMAIKPSTLKGFEQWCNHWVSSRKLSQHLDKQNKSLDEWMSDRPKRLGLFLILAASYILLNLLLLFFNMRH
jgi:hypothetical protein